MLDTLYTPRSRKLFWDCICSVAGLLLTWVGVDVGETTDTNAWLLRMLRTEIYS